jgi:hypothetical protein
MKAVRLVAILCLLMCIALPSFAQDKVLVDLKRFRPRQLKMAGFELGGETKLSVNAVGIRHRNRQHDLRLSSAWILNADTRDVVWTLRDANSDEMPNDLREYKDSIRLPKGRYEVYFASFPMYREEGMDFDFGELRDSIGEWWDDLFDRDFDYDDYRDAAREFKIVIRGAGTPFDKGQVLEYQQGLSKGAVLAATGLRKNHYEATTMKLDRDMELQIYAIGEVRKDGNYDFAWIVDTKTRDTVWRLDYRNSEPAGGARKNRMYKDTISLPKGEYAVFCVTDDSHDTGKWNSTPPYDPYYWGLTIQAADPNMGRNASLAEYKDVDEGKVVVEFTRLGDSEFEGMGFTLKKSMKLRVYAIGEGRDGDMYDYSWIIDADTRETVWKMKFRDTEHAGGASKNRMVDQVITLEKGNYIAYAVTDGSHSYPRWNASAPFDRKRWGLTVVAESGNMRDVSEYVEEEDKNVLAKIVRVGDRVNERESFTLDRSHDVVIYAIGEGSDGRMYDYAWIESAETGRVVWEMTYRRTDHAGGARKNRMINDTIKLDAGEYYVYYESDGSHSFRSWNANPPADRMNWGVTIKLTKAR